MLNGEYRLLCASTTANFEAVRDGFDKRRGICVKVFFLHPKKCRLIGQADSSSAGCAVFGVECFWPRINTMHGVVWAGSRFSLKCFEETRYLRPPSFAHRSTSAIACFIPVTGMCRR